MNGIADQPWAPYVAILLFAVGLGVGLAAALTNENGLLRTTWNRYVAAVDSEVRFMQYKVTGARIAFIQLGIICALLLGALVLVELLLAMLIPFVAAVPMIVLQRRHAERVIKIDEQLDVWLVALSNSLKGAPSLGDAISSSARLSQVPLREELELVLKEMNLGLPLDEALRSLATRVGSRAMWGAIATLLVARQTGGDVSRILEDSAASLREMARLDGVVQSKTAEGRNQAYVLAAVPFVLIGAIHAIDNAWLAPLTESALGYLVLAGSAFLWGAGFIMARKILAVDI